MSERTNLRRFLLDARARLSPADIGLSVTGRRRAAGLRREEVADLAGISEAWYRRFEAGRAQLSRKALLRVAAALKLDPRETCELVRLATAPSSSETIEAFGQGTAELRAVRRLFRGIQSVSSLAEARTVVVRALVDVAHSPSLAFWVEEAEPNGGFSFLESDGPHGALFHGSYEEPQVMAHFDREHLLTRPVSENLAKSPSEVHRANAARIGSGDYRAVPVQPLSFDRSIRIGWASREVGRFPAINAVAHDLIGDYTRWALTGLLPASAS